ncbi:alpha/beta hydrolase [Asticcacaulis sp.]|uniref:alpha/beta hydrolase n=1 Tax=Asticcacaulis sp. TaxID=1872648 RepID=UPI002C0E2059|nr:alpha/beta hydrolase [Asticcacaulis sp.]HTM82215.1 alpha/beta hydrolase [Asticcacaulis sp.]
MTQMRAMIAPNKGKLRGIAARAPYDAIMGRVLPPDGVSFRPDTIGGVTGWWCEPENAQPHAAVLHAHGGWFTWGSGKSFRHLVGHIARSARISAFVPDYRLAPEHPFPAALEDVHASYLGLVESGVQSIALSGDSAGGNLTLALLALITAQSPANNATFGAVVLSPVTDLAMTGRSWESRANADPFFMREQAEELVRGYLGGRDAADHTASPLYGDLAGLPPIRVHVGDDEVLLEDSLRYVERAVAAGVDAKVDVWEGMAHGFVGSIGRLDAATAALGAIGAFLATRFAVSRSA